VPLVRLGGCPGLKKAKKQDRCGNVENCCFKKVIHWGSRSSVAMDCIFMTHHLSSLGVILN
jgi:hypothetical protein